MSPPGHRAAPGSAGRGRRRLSRTRNTKTSEPVGVRPSSFRGVSLVPGPWSLSLSLSPEAAQASVFPGTRRSCSSKMNLRCFSSTDPAAVNASLVYDDNVSSGSLYEREDQQIPLPLCSSSSLPPSSRCLVCRADALVHVVCSNLVKGAKVMLEALGDSIKIKEGDCPQPPSDEVQTVDGRWWLLLLLLIPFIIIIIYCKLKRSNRANEDLRGGDVELNHQAEPLNQVPGGSDEGPTSQK